MSYIERFKDYASRFPFVLHGAGWAAANDFRELRHETRNMTWAMFSDFIFFQTEADAVEGKLLCPELRQSSIAEARGWTVSFDARRYIAHDEELFQDDGLFGVKYAAIHGLYSFGSQVYGTARWRSDRDLILVADGVIDGTEHRSPGHAKNIIRTNVHFYTPAVFTQKVRDHDVVALECFFNADQRSTMLDIDFDLDLQKLRRSFSAKASNSWVKCKKKLEVEHDYYNGKKSLWHALRILMMGADIAKNGRITDYGCANHLYCDIVDSPRCDWNYFKENYQPLFNQLNTEFRKRAPL